MSWFLAPQTPVAPIREPPAAPRVGLTAGKVLGKAHERNRIKRRMREALRRHVDLLPAGFDLIFHPRRIVLTLEFAKLEAEIVRILQQAGAEAARSSKLCRAQSPGDARTMTRILLALIAFYRRWLSPVLHSLHPGGCKYLPTCWSTQPWPSPPMARCAALGLPPGDFCAAIPLRAEDSIPSPRLGPLTQTSRTLMPQRLSPTNLYHR